MKKEGALNTIGGFIGGTAEAIAIPAGGAVKWVIGLPGRIASRVFGGAQRIWSGLWGKDVGHEDKGDHGTADTEAHAH